MRSPKMWVHGKSLITRDLRDIANIQRKETMEDRDREGREIDFILENGKGTILGIEVKTGSVVSKDDFKHILWFKHNIVPDKEFIGIVVYTGENVLPFGADLRAVPIAALWTW